MRRIVVVMQTTLNLALELVESRSFDAGAVVNRYRVAEVRPRA